MPKRAPMHRPTGAFEGRAGYDRAYNRNRPPHLAKIYDSKRWKALRAMKRRRNAACERCEARGEYTLADQVHHIKPVRTHPHLAYVYENLMSVCFACHAQLETEAAS